MKTRLLSLSIGLLVITHMMWGQSVVSTDSQLRSAVEADNANIQLANDINLSNSTLSIASGKTVTIDLNGHTLDRKLTKRGEGGGTVITVREGATLLLSNGTLRGGWGGAGGGLVNEGGTVTLTDVIISDNIADDRGGGVCNSAGTMTITGGLIHNNMSMDGTNPTGGGGIFNAEGATLTLSQVTITGNECTLYGGGGICNYGFLTLDNCTITGNKARSVGGGVWCGNEKHKFKMQGANIITDNTASGNTSNLYMLERRLITCTGSLTGSHIGITLDVCPNMFTSGFPNYHSGDDYAAIFSCDRPLCDSLDITDTSVPAGEVILRSRVQDHWVPYIEHSWDEENHVVRSTEKMLTTEIGFNDTPTDKTQYKRLHSSDNVMHIGTENSTIHEYFVVMDEEVAIYSMSLDGPNVHIILCDKAWLHLHDELYVGQDQTVYIHAQSTGSSMGRLTNDESSMSTGGIGGYGSDYGGNIEIHGGSYDLKGYDDCAAIGGRFAKKSGDITIYDGRIKAKGADGSAGIGAGNGCEDFGHITIYGGVIDAEGGDRATPDPAGGAGIGGGGSTCNGKLTIWGGHITARGKNESAGIGSSQIGCDEAAGTVVINGGIVKAYGDSYGAGIGGGDGKRGGALTINGGFVEAYGGTDAAGIGGGEGGDGGNVTINGGHVVAQGKDNGAGIGGGEDGSGGNVTINGGIVIAGAGYDETGCRAIGPGEGSDNYGKLTIGDDMMVGSERKAAAAERINMCWYRTWAKVQTCDHSDGFTYTVDGATATDHHMSHCPYCLHSDTALHTFDGKGQCTVCGVQSEVKTVKLWVPAMPYDGKTYKVASTHSVVPNSDYVLMMSSLIVPEYKFIGWEAVSGEISEPYESPYTTATADTLYRAGNRYKVTDDIHFVARYQTAPAPTAIEEVQGDKVPNTKYIYEGILYIEQNNKKYNIQGNIIR